MFAHPRVVVLLASAIAAAPTPGQTKLTAPSATLVRELQIDGNTEDLTIINALTIGPAGRIAFTQPQDYQVRMYDATGKRLVTFGRRGDGPGEFQFLFPISGWVADTLWVYDNNHRRITLIAPDGKLAREVTMPSVFLPALNGGPPMRDTPSLLAVYPGGTMLFKVLQERGVPDPANGLTAPDKRQLGIAGGDGAVTRVIGQVPTSIGSMTIQRGGGMYSTGAPYVANPIESVSPDGSRIAYLTTNLTSNTGGEYRITVMSARGDTTLKRAYPFTGVPVPGAIVDSVVDQIGRPRPARGNMPPMNWPPEVVETLRDAARKMMPPVYPFIRTFKLGVDGTMWITPRDTTGGARWFMLDDKGNMVASLALAKGEVFAHGSRTHVWTTGSDADGVQSIFRYRITGIR